jgi:mono/diheme cytochrome c family protein
MVPSSRLRAFGALAMGVVLVSLGDARAQTDSYYLGWRQFQTSCAGCHGADAAGTDKAPNLLPRVKGMSEGRFVATVLQRYQWVLPAGEAAREGAAREALIEDILRRREGESLMPAWEGEPSVKAHILDLFAYLNARASGALAPGRPEQAR